MVFEAGHPFSLSMGDSSRVGTCDRCVQQFLPHSMQGIILRHMPDHQSEQDFPLPIGIALDKGIASQKLRVAQFCERSLFLKAFSFSLAYLTFEDESPLSARLNLHKRISLTGE